MSDSASKPGDANGHATHRPEGSSLGPLLEDAIRHACNDRLSRIAWFRSDWQRGGGSTGFATFTTDAGEPTPVVVKLPVGSIEYRWTATLGRHDHSKPCDHFPPTPRIYAAGEALNGYDLAWLVMERLPGDPIAAALSAQCIADLMQATARWHAAAVKVAQPSPEEAGPTLKHDWEKLITRSRDVAKRGSIEHAQHWNVVLKDVHRALPTMLMRWDARPINTWCHGDLHPGNVMRRSPDAAGPQGTPRCVLIDLALVHPGHWIEDALYLERVRWGHPHHLFGINAISALSAARRELGLDSTGDYGLLANTRRVLAAAGAPAMMEREGNPRYVQFALDTIHKLLPMVAH